MELRAHGGLGWGLLPAGSGHCETLLKDGKLTAFDEVSGMGLLSRSRWGALPADIRAGDAEIGELLLRAVSTRAVCPSLIKSGGEGMGPSSTENVSTWA